MVMPGDNVTMEVTLIYPVALNIGFAFCDREGEVLFGGCWAGNRDNK